MKPRHVMALRMRSFDLGDNFVQRQRRGVDDARSGRAMREDILRHQRPGIEADRAGRDQVASAQGEEIGRARAGADEMHGHFTTLHCTTGREASHDRMRPSGATCAISIRISSPP